MEIGLFLLIAYLLGSLVPGLWIAQAYGVDIRQVGSGNIGSTNVYRALGFWPGFWVQVIDIGKAVVAVALVRWRFSEVWVWYSAATAAVLGHLYPIWAGLRGGKGVNTLLGAALMIEPLTALGAVGVFGLVLGVFRYVSLSSMVAVSSFALWHGIVGEGHLVGYLFGALWAALVIYTHRANIIRLLRGCEPRVGGQKP
jgi:glycerol-3-phosphate acyltransferase PlsY